MNITAGQMARPRSLPISRRQREKINACRNRRGLASSLGAAAVIGAADGGFLNAK
jgi:hypothetical protein